MSEGTSIEIVFERALKMVDQVDLSSYLDEVCGSDQAMRGQVESLIAAHDSAGPGFMDTFAGAIWERESDDREGDFIGGYQLLKKIGEGGFGTVYRVGKPLAMERQGALKVIKAGMEAREVIARFEVERQALKLMDHPNIVKIYDSGSRDGKRPYFVMELVKGVPITKYCLDNDLDIRARLALFQDVCKAVQYCHEKGVVHRDLKPSNIMVSLLDGNPVVKIIDFGIAKAAGLEVSVMTERAQSRRMMGTPQYMSPEQADLDGREVDDRCDLYSLGVLLYELLTGATPLDGSSLHRASHSEIQRQIMEEVPTKPSLRLLGDSSSLTSWVSPAVLHRDLDRIVLKALRKDRECRHESVLAFARDLRRLMVRRPVSKMSPSVSSRAEIFIRGNRAPFFRSAAALVALLLALSISWGMWHDSSIREREEMAEAGCTRPNKGASSASPTQSPEEAWGSMAAFSKETIISMKSCRSCDRGKG